MSRCFLCDASENSDVESFFYEGLTKPENHVTILYRLRKFNRPEDVVCQLCSESITEALLEFDPDGGTDESVFVYGVERVQEDTPTLSVRQEF